MSVTAILQARTSSSRLPGKIMMDVCGQPMLARQIERVKRSRQIDTLVVATSYYEDDDPVAELAEWLEVPCVRGPLADVLDRFAKAANSYPADHILRLTGDCPLADPTVIDALIAFHTDNGFDYASNTLERTYPHGLDAEIMRAEALKTAWREAETDHEREHVTPYLYANPQMFRLGGMRHSANCAHHRWTVDYPEDLSLVHAVFEALLPENPDFSWTDVMAFLDAHPDVAAINAARRRFESGAQQHSEEVGVQ